MAAQQFLVAAAEDSEDLPMTRYNVATTQQRGSRVPQASDKEQESPEMKTSAENWDV